MRALVIGPTPPPHHGVAVFVRRLVDELPRASGGRFEVVHLDTSDRRDTGNLGRWDVTNVRLGIQHVLALVLELLRTRPRIVYVPISQNVPAFLRDALFVFVAAALGARVVVHLHGGYLRELYEAQTAWFRRVVEVTLRRSAAVIVLSDVFRPIFSGLVPPDRVHVVENGVTDPGAWALRSLDRRPEPSGGTVLFLSSLSRTKGILDLLRAIAIVRTSRPAIRLRVAGNWRDDETRAEALALVESERLGSHVEFVGNVDGEDKAAFLADGDVFCLPANANEGQPLALLEAMAAGLPVLSTRHPAIAATAPDGAVARLVDSDAGPAAIAAGLDEMLDDPDRLGRLAHAGRDRYVERYTLDACLRGLVSVFDEAAR